LKKIIPHLKHAYTMANRNIKSYAFLSTTVILSFTFLILFFMITDSNTYNKYKEYFAVPESIVRVGANNSFGHDNPALSKLDIIENSLDSNYIRYATITRFFSHYSDNHTNIHAKIYFVPANWNDFFENNAGIFKHLKKIGGAQIFNAPNEVVVDENLFNMLVNNRSEEFVLEINTSDNSPGVMKFKVIGVYEALDQNVSFIMGENNSMGYYVNVFLPIDAIKYFKIEARHDYILVDSSNANEIINLANELDLEVFSSLSYQKQAKEQIKNEIYLKGVIALILYFLLGLNLYSSFNNALNERKYEIGVKRSLGAGYKHIIWQFFSEGVIVMTLNIVLSVIVALNLIIAYKIYLAKVDLYEYTVYISKFSMFTLAISFVSLSILFILIFAYKSTKIEIIQQLKAE